MNRSSVFLMLMRSKILYRKRHVFHKHIFHIKLNKRKKCLFCTKICLKWLVFRKIHADIKNTEGIMCFSVISLKFLIANWDALISFPLVSFFSFKSKNILFDFYFFFLFTRLFLVAKSSGPGAVHPLVPLKPPVGNFILLYTTNLILKIREYNHRS